MTKTNRSAAKKQAKVRKPARDDPEQSRRFVKDAKKLEADDDDTSEADAVMGRMGAKPHKPHKP